MNQMTNTDYSHDIDVSNIIPGEADIPQIADEDVTIVDIVHCTTGKTHDLIDAELHNQVSTY